MRTLLIGKTWPEPGSSAAGGRTLELLRSFRDAGWPTSFATAASESPHTADLRELGIDSHSISVNDSAFDQWIQNLDPDLVVFDRYMIEEQFGWRVEKNCPDALRVIDTIDLHCLREARRLQLRSNGDLDLFNEIALREIAAIFRSDLSFIISEVEMEILKTQFQIPPAQLAYLPLMLPEPDESAPDFDARKNFVMIGNYLHEPNWDAVQWCCREIWPLVHQKLPTAELHIFGAYEPAKARQFHNESRGILIRGRAPDALATLSQFRVNLAPLRFGAGQKGKIADAFLTGTPTVATPIAAESMNGPIDWGCPIASAATEFAETAVALHENREIWHRVRQQGFAIARERLTAATWKPRLIARLLELRETALANRHRNFIGRLLRHHQHRSTEFMSRWIEAKNKLPPTA